MLPLRCRDPRLALSGFWASAQATVQPTPGLAIEWGLLARGAAAGLCPAPLEGALGTKAPSNTLLKVVVCHTEISA